jgi:hypothetical protein
MEFCLQAVQLCMALWRNPVVQYNSLNQVNAYAINFTVVLSVLTGTTGQG